MSEENMAAKSKRVPEFSVFVLAVMHNLLDKMRKEWLISGGLSIKF